MFKYFLDEKSMRRRRYKVNTNPNIFHQTVISDIVVIIYMKQFTLFICLLVGVRSFQQYSHFILEYQKNYNSSELFQRERYYNQTKKKSELMAIHGFSVGVNKYWDSSQQEQQQLTTGVKLHQLNITSQNDTQHLRVNNQKINYNIDWRQNFIITPVRDQGNQAASAWVFQYLAFVEAIHKMQTGQTIDLSQRFLLSCGEEPTLGANYLQQAEKTSNKLGIALEKYYPYNRFNPLDGNTSMCTKQKNQVKKIELNLQYYLSDKQLIYYLSKGPLIVYVHPQSWLLYSGGIFECNQTMIEEFKGHAVLLVGVTQEYWVAKNSWGQGWGEAGYIRINRNRKKNCGIGLVVYIDKNIHLSFEYSHLLSLMLMLLILIIFLL